MSEGLDIPAYGLPTRPRFRSVLLKGSVWIAGGYAASQVLRLASNVVLTRLLAPEAFGLMMLVQVFMQGLQMFSDVGIGPSIIRHDKGEDAAFLNTAWTIQALRGGLLWATAAVLAWPVAVFYGEPQLTSLIIVASFGAVISGFNSTALFTLNRKMLLGRLTILELTSQSIGIVAMIACSWAWPTVWALVVGGLLSAAARCFASHRLQAHRDAFAWNTSARNHLLSFGRAVGLSTAITFLANQSERFLLGKFVPMDVLGVYGVGFMLARFGTMVLQQIMSKALFPSLANELRLDQARALSQYRRVRSVVDVIAVGLALVLIPFGPILIRHLYDNRYWNAGWMLQILAVQAAFDLMRTPASWLLLAAGRPGYNVWAGTLRLLVLCAGLPLAFVWGDMKAAVWVIALSSAPSLFIFTWGVGQCFPELRRSERRSAVLITAMVQGIYFLLA
jgi:O-antigen/teichoic acid export membrane protein